MSPWLNAMPHAVQYSFSKQCAEPNLLKVSRGSLADKLPQHVTFFLTVIFF